MDKEKALKVALLIAKAVEETVQEAGEQGAASGVVYAAMMGFGISLQTYESLIEVLIASGRIRRIGHVLYAS